MINQWNVITLVDGVHSVRFGESERWILSNAFSRQQAEEIQRMLRFLDPRPEDEEEKFVKAIISEVSCFPFVPPNAY